MDHSASRLLQKCQVSNLRWHWRWTRRYYEDYFYVYNGFENFTRARTGFGFEFHAVSAALATAVELGRVFLFAEYLTARYRNDFCRTRGYQTFDCYFEPMSNCTLADALEVLKADLLEKEASRTVTWSGLEDTKLEDAVDLHGLFLNWDLISEEIASGKTGEDCHIHWRIRFLNTVLSDGEIATNTSSFPRKTFDHIKNAIHGIDFSEFDVSHHMFTEDVLYSINVDRFIVPSELVRLRKGSGLNPANDIDWWRAITSAYLIRPNPDTLAFIEGLRDPILKAKEGRCVSTYIRHGDKAVEMELLGFESYKVATLALFNDSDVFPEQPTGSERLLYLATGSYYRPPLLCCHLCSAVILLLLEYYRGCCCPRRGGRVGRAGKYNCAILQYPERYHQGESVQLGCD